MMASKRINLLLISYYYPPFATIGALRPASFAKWLPYFGIDVTVVTPRWQRHIPRDFSMSGQGELIHTSILSIDELIHLAKGLRHKIQPSSLQVTGAPYRIAQQNNPSKIRLNAGLYELLHFPDNGIGWYPFALDICLRLIREKAFDVVLSSAPPMTCHLIAAELKRRTGLRWIADYRDAISSNPYLKPRSIRVLDKWEQSLERHAIASADRIITTSVPYQQLIRSALSVERVEVIYNGYEPEDTPPVALSREGAKYTITYTGELNDTRDPSPLFAALKLNKETGLDALMPWQVNFYGDTSNKAIDIAASFGLTDIVHAYVRLPRNEVLRKQMQSTVLMFIDTMEPAKQLAISGKVYEYMATGKPLLGIASSTGAMGHLLKDFANAKVSTVPMEILQFLTSLPGQVTKSSVSKLNHFATGAKEYSRQAQAYKLAHVVADLTTDQLSKCV